MYGQMGGFPYWQVWFDEKGKPDEFKRRAVVREVPQNNLRHLFVFSHGWNNDSRMAEDLYSRFFTQLGDVLDHQGISRAGVGVVGVIWPSMRWADEAPRSAAGGAASAGRGRAAVRSDGDLVRELKAVYAKPKQKKAIDEMARLLDERPADAKAKARFQKLMAELAPKKLPPEDDAERALLKKPPGEVFGAMKSLSPAKRRAAAGAIGDLWNGAKEALRATTYWEMKERAGVVGKKGLGPLITEIHDAAPDVKIHLIGHSFGARLVSFSLAGLPAFYVGATSPVKSLMLVQGAFSHFAFADTLEFNKQGGALKGMQARVDGPLLATHTLKDTALCVYYEKASMIARQNTAAARRKVSLWGAMGSTGARAVDAQDLKFANVGRAYDFTGGKFFNLDGNSFMVQGGPPSGAHSDIVYDKIAWALACGAGLA